MPVSCYGIDSSYNEGDDSPRNSPRLIPVHPNFNPRESPPPLQLPRVPLVKAQGNLGDAVLIHFLASGQNPEIAHMAGQRIFPSGTDTLEDDPDDLDDQGRSDSGDEEEEQEHVCRSNSNNDDLRDRDHRSTDDSPRLRASGPKPTTTSEKLNLRALAVDALTVLTSDQASSNAMWPEHKPSSTFICFDSGSPGHVKLDAQKNISGKTDAFLSHQHSKLSTSTAGNSTVCLGSSDAVRDRPPRDGINGLPARQSSTSVADLDHTHIPTPPINDATIERLEGSIGVAGIRRVNNGSVSQSLRSVSMLSILEPTSAPFAGGARRTGMVERLRGTSTHIASSTSSAASTISPPASSINTSITNPISGGLRPLQQQPEIGSQILLPPLRSLDPFVSHDNEPPLQYPFSNSPRPPIALPRNHDGSMPYHASPPLSPGNFSSPAHSTPETSPSMFPLAPVSVLPEHDRPVSLFTPTTDTVSVGASTGATRSNMLPVLTSSTSSMSATADLMAIDSITTPTFACTQPGCTVPPFATQYLLNSHANVHSSNRPHYCRVAGCVRSAGGVGFKRKNEMIRHRLVHESPGYICPFCPQRDHRYPRPDNLQRHVRVHHPERNKDDQLLRDVLAQRPEGQNPGRRQRGATSTK